MEVDEFTYPGSIVSKKGGTDEDIQARIGKARQVMLRPVRRSTALRTTRTRLLLYETDQGTEAEVAGVHQQEPTEEHPADLVAQTNP